MFSIQIFADAVNPDQADKHCLMLYRYPDQKIFIPYEQASDVIEGIQEALKSEKVERIRSEDAA